MINYEIDLQDSGNHQKSSLVRPVEVYVPVSQL
jgi:hypothetical protein